jgi:hypothetical protein
MMSGWLRANLRWDFTFGIVGILAGVFGAVFIAVERFISAEVCLGLAGLTLVLWSTGRRGQLKYLLILAITGGFLFLVYSIDEYRIQKDLEGFNQHLQSQSLQQAQNDLQEIKNLLLENNGKQTPAPKLQDFIDSRNLERKYLLGFALFYADGRKTLYYARPSSAKVVFDPSNLQVRHVGETSWQMNIVPIRMGGQLLPITDITITNPNPTLVVKVMGVSVYSEPLVSSTDGAAWVIGLKPST